MAIGKGPIFQHKERSRKYKPLYGITEEDVHNMLNDQKGCCKICGADLGLESRQYCIDHDHETLEVRGLLCFNCNINLGWYEKVKENIEMYDKYIMGEA